MNDIMEAVKAPPKRPDHEFLTLSEGSVVSIEGVLCRLQYLHRGKRRLTFVPVQAGQPMPVSEVKDPVIKVTTKGR